MTFYQELQLNQAGSKLMIQEAVGRRAKAWHLLVYPVKILLTMVFCVAFVALYGWVFGAENNIVGVVVLLCLMVFRQADLGMRRGQSLLALGLVFLVLAFGPRLANLAELGGELAVHGLSLLVILVLGCHNVGMGNHLTLVLGYLLLYGYDVEAAAFPSRLAALAVGCGLTLLVYARNHRADPYWEGIPAVLRAWSLGEARSRWQLKAAFGVATALVLAHGLGFPRPMWMGIAAMSVLLPSRQAIPGRVKGRIWGNLAGGAGFCLLYCLLPGSLLPYLGIFGGIGVGLSATYGWQAVFNSLGAMSIMVGTLGLPGVVLFRVGNNALGALYAWAVDRLAGPAWRVLRRAAS